MTWLLGGVLFLLAIVYVAIDGISFLSMDSMD